MITYNLLPRYGERYVNEITRKDIQDFLFELTDAGKNRTAAKLKQLLSAIFDVICEDYGIKTPMAKIVLNYYEVKKGKAFIKEEKKTIIDFCKENPHYLGNSSIHVLLFTGMRVGELPSLQYDGTFITRAKESGCNPELVMKWVGHEFDADVKTSKVDRGYTDYSQEYVLKEISKIDYEL